MRDELDLPQISFRPLRSEDLPLMHRWLNADHVAEWYDIGGVVPPNHEQVVAHYSPLIAGEGHADPYLILYEDVPIGYIQTYRISDYPGYARALQVEDGAWGGDLFIGEPGSVHRGLGAPILRRFLADIVFGLSAATACVIGPDPANAAAISAYAKAGFRYLKTVDVPGGDPPVEYLMRIAREDVIDISGDIPHRS